MTALNTIILFGLVLVKTKLYLTSCLVTLGIASAASVAKCADYYHVICTCFPLLFCPLFRGDACNAVLCQ